MQFFPMIAGREALVIYVVVLTVESCHQLRRQELIHIFKLVPVRAAKIEELTMCHCTEFVCKDMRTFDVPVAGKGFSNQVLQTFINIGDIKQGRESGDELREYLHHPTTNPFVRGFVVPGGRHDHSHFADNRN
jgi:hypothetical protein